MITRMQRAWITLGREAMRDARHDDAVYYFARATRLAGRNRKDRKVRVVSRARVTECLLELAIDRGADIDTVIIPRLLENGVANAKVMGL